MFSVVDWLAKVCPDHVDQVIEALAALVANSHVERYEYLSQSDLIRAMLVEGRNGSTATIQRVEEVVSFLASIGQTSYLDLVPPVAVTPMVG